MTDREQWARAQTHTDALRARGVCPNCAMGLAQNLVDRELGLVDGDHRIPHLCTQRRRQPACADLARAVDLTGV